MRVTIRIPSDRSSQLNASLHYEAGLDWFDLNANLDSGKTLDLSFRLDDASVATSVPRVRRLLDVLARNYQKAELVVEGGPKGPHRLTSEQLLALLLQIHRPTPQPTLVRTDDPILALRDAISETGPSPWADRLVAAARPTLSFDASSVVSADEELPVGTTKLWGAPDLPQGFPWPTRRVCTAAWDGADELDPDEKCSFDGQFDLNDLAGTASARWLPNEGLLSFFSCTEYDTIGTVAAIVLWFPPGEALERQLPPTGVERRATVRLRLLETVSLPEPNGPAFSELAAAGLPQQDYARLALPYTPIAPRLLGYSSTSTAGDVSPSAEWVHLAHLETSCEWTYSLAIRNEDLTAWRLDRVQMIYAHPD